jgi:UPF0755 protein
VKPLRWIALGLLSVLILGLGVRFLQAVHSASANSGEVYFEIRKGEGARNVAGRLRDAGIWDSPKWFIFQASWKGVASRLKYGEYAIPPHASTDALLALFASGKVRQYAFTIVEGWNIEQLLSALKAQPALDHHLAEKTREQLLVALGFSGAHPEGRFLPDTYLFPKGYSDVELLKRAREKMEAALETEWGNRQPGLPYANAYAALILASIVEKETALDVERPRVAGVFMRRLQRGMRLQADPTVIYGMGAHYQGDITRKALLQDSPYNTYTRSGLPPTPIAMPGLASLRAALHPDSGDSLYFVAAGDGSHVFSSNLAEHERAVAAFLRQRHD